MSDWTQPEASQAPPPSDLQPPYESPPAPEPMAAMPVGAPPQPPKKRTGLIVAIVVIGVLLLCCCATAGGIAVLGPAIFSSDGSSGTSSTTKTDPEAEKRAADWKKVTDAFVRGDYQFVEPDERQRRLVEAAVAQLLPDFTVDEVVIEPGRYDKERDYYVFDDAFVRLHLTSDPAAKTAYSFNIETPDAESAKLARDDLDVADGKDAMQLEGRTWIIFPTNSKAPLMKGMTDPAIGGLIAQACADWPDGLPTRFTAGADGSWVLAIETWDSYCWSDTFDRIDATYVRDGDGWKLKGWVPIVEPKNTGSEEPTRT